MDCGYKIWLSRLTAHAVINVVIMKMTDVNDGWGIESVTQRPGYSCTIRIQITNDLNFENWITVIS